MMDAACFFMNPVNCTDPITTETHDSKLRSAMGYKRQITLQTIQRSTSAALRSPWELKNLCKRADHLRALNDIMEEETRIVRQLRYSTVPSVMLLGGMQQMRLMRQYCPCTLADLLEERFRNQLGPLEVVQAKKVVVTVLNTIEYLHVKLHMVHGDLKSFNIMITENFQMIKLCGFGAKSKKLGSTGTVERRSYPDISESIGIGLWSAPEVLENKRNINVDADIFSFGLLVYEMLACMPPHTFPGIMDTGILEPEALLDTYSTTQTQRDAIFRPQIPKSKQRTTARMSTAPLPPFLRKVTKRTHRETLPPAVNTKRMLSSPQTNTKPLTASCKNEGIRIPDSDEKPSELAKEDKHKATQTAPPLEVSNCLNYACLGTRPLLPSLAALGIEYKLLYDIFYVCTEYMPAVRPSATLLLYACKVAENSKD